MLIESESRICFGLAWYDNEEEANKEGQRIFKSGRTVNGGYFDGMPCGRDKSWDYTTPEGLKLYAVRT